MDDQFEGIVGNSAGSRIVREPIEHLCVKCSPSARAMVETLLGLPTVVVGNGNAPEKLLYFQLNKPAESLDERAALELVCEFIAKLTGGDSTYVPPEQLNPKIYGIIAQNLVELNLIAALHTLFRAAKKAAESQAKQSDGDPKRTTETTPEIPDPQLKLAQSQSIAVKFLEKLRPGGPWVLIAIVPDSPGPPDTITVRTTDQVEAFIHKHDGKAGLYYSVNPTRTAMGKKAKKTNIAAIEYALADLDPAEDETSEAAKARYLTQLNDNDSFFGTFEPKPTAGIDSGNGIQGLWRLKERIILGEPINGKFSPEDQAKIDDVEARIEAIMLRLGAKAGTQNIDRILRLPGTTNLPNAKKRKEGRVVCQTKLLWFDDVSYPLETFPKEETGKEKPEPETFDVFEDIAPTDPRLAKLDQKWVALGFEGKGILENYAGDRSRAVMAFACECVRAKIADKVIASCLMKWEIGQHLREQGSVKRALQRTITRAHEFVADSPLFKMNEQHAVLPIGGKTRVATWGEDPDFPGYQTITRFSPFGDFKALHDKYRIEYQVKDNNGNAKTVTVGRGSWWIKNPGRRQYDGGMRFMPERDEDVVNDALNLWNGFGIPARKPEGKSGAAGCKLLLDHGRKIICSGNEEHFEYLMKREAFIAQRRTLSEVAVALRTIEEGTGKGFWCRSLNRLYGVHAMQLQKPEHVIGKHNKHIEILLRLTADEALFVGDPRHRNALFGLITEPTNTIEPKNIDAYNANNYVNVDILSNARHFIPVSGTARRFMVPTVSEERASDHEYFRKIQAQLKNDGGYEALLWHLLHEIDIRDFNVRAVPKTAALAEQAAYSRNGIELLVEMACNEGCVPCTHQEHPEMSCTTERTGTYAPIAFDDFIGRHPNRELARMGPLTVKRRLATEWGCMTGKAIRKQSNGVRVYGLVWPPLPELRKRFEKKFGPQEWLYPRATEWRRRDEEKTAVVDVDVVVDVDTAVAKTRARRKKDTELDPELRMQLARKALDPL